MDVFHFTQNKNAKKCLDFHFVVYVRYSFPSLGCQPRFHRFFKRRFVRQSGKLCFANHPLPLFSYFSSIRWIDIITAKTDDYIMLVIKSITIENFRSIEYLRSPQFSKFNLITGENTSGKSSLLEALFLSVGATNPALAVNIHKFRQMVFNSDDVFRFLFRDLDLNNQLTISIETDSSVRSLGIQPYYSEQDRMNESIQKTTSSKTASIQEGNRLSGIKFDFSESEIKFSTVFSLKDGFIRTRADYEEKFYASSISQGVIMDNLSESIDNIIVNKQKELLVTALKEIDPNISDIAIGKDGIVYADLGLKQLLPVNLLGYGMIKILILLAQISNKGLTTIFIDEIENGLHYSSMNTMWKALLKVAGDRNIQLFATTHSYDCIEAYNENLKSLGLQQHSQLFRIKRKETHELIPSDYDELKFALANNLEVR